MNTLTIIGNVGGEPELRYTQSGLAQVKFSVATTYGKDDKKKTTWHNCLAWGEMAEAIASVADKGTRVVVIGRMETSEYTTKQGEKRKSQEVVVDDFGVSLRWGAPQQRKKFSDAAKPSQQMSIDDEEPF